MIKTCNKGNVIPLYQYPIKHLPLRTKSTYGKSQMTAEKLENFENAVKL